MPTNRGLGDVQGQNQPQPEQVADGEAEGHGVVWAK